MNPLKDGERLDDLEFDGLKIIQHPDKYCFTSDAVLLANLLPKSKKLCDFGTGSGIIAIIAAAKGIAETVDALELQSDLADMAQRSISFNGLNDKINIIQGNIKDSKKLLKSEYYDTVSCNPPFFRADSGKMRGSDGIALARHELEVTFAEITKNAAAVLKFSGRFCFIQKCTRLAETIATVKSFNLEPKKITFIRPTADTPPDTFVCECKKGANPDVQVDILTVFGPDRTMTDAAKKLYNKN